MKFNDNDSDDLNNNNVSASANDSIFFYPAQNNVLRKRFEQPHFSKASKILRRKQRGINNNNSSSSPFDNTKTSYEESAATFESASAANLSSNLKQQKHSASIPDIFHSTSEIFIGSRSFPNTGYKRELNGDLSTSLLDTSNLNASSSRLPLLSSCIVASKPTKLKQHFLFPTSLVNITSASTIYQSQQHRPF
jgi:hypothetical protein